MQATGVRISSAEFYERYRRLDRQSVLNGLVHVLRSAPPETWGDDPDVRRVEESLPRPSPS